MQDDPNKMKMIIIFRLIQTIQSHKFLYLSILSLLI